MFHSAVTDRSDLAAVARWQLTIRGQVQGVGFRPAVYRLARRFGLAGSVANTSDGVLIELQGSVERLESFLASLPAALPPLARIDDLRQAVVPARDEDRDFRIAASERGRSARASIAVDTAVCTDCLSEMRDRSDRRFGYGLINCTNCGPRYSIIRKVPYDRPHTTMSGFGMCRACEAEYTAADDRRFHAQPIACQACGPQVSLANATGQRIDGDPIELAAGWLREGRIVAIKGLGGFHLACRADSQAAVARLRQAKRRIAKPFALMCQDMAEAEKLIKLGSEARSLLADPLSPIVLAQRRESVTVAEAVAPGTDRLGVMLAYTPIHHLLFDADAPSVLVMTSGNQSDQPLAIDNDEALARLGGMCDTFLWHDRPIERCVDDSVVLDMGGGRPVLPIRRSRGFAPAVVARLGGGKRVPDGICLGGELKNTVALVRDGEVVLSPHVGDLKHVLSFQAFQRTVADLCNLFEVSPQWVACDAHPQYLSTQHALALATRLSIPFIKVQHHHAHALSVLAEHGRDEPTLAIVCDGVGYGTDGTTWGGELMRVDGAHFQRLGHLRPIRLAGADAAATDTRRCALGLMYEALGADFARHRWVAKLIPDPREAQMLTAMVRTGCHCATSSAAGRVFDGVAALLGVCARNNFEAQAGLALEALARQAPTRLDGQNLFSIQPSAERGGAMTIDLSPLIRSLLKQVEAGVEAPVLATLFHQQLAKAWVAAAAGACEAMGIHCVALSGGVMCNQIVSELIREGLEARRITVLQHETVPPNDGGLALGQAVAGTRWMTEACFNARRER